MKRKFSQAVVMPIPDDCDIDSLKYELGLLDYNVKGITNHKEQSAVRFLRNFDDTGKLGKCFISPSPFTEKKHVHYMGNFDILLFCGLASLNENTETFPGEWIRTTANRFYIIDSCNDKIAHCYNILTSTKSKIKVSSITKLTKVEIVELNDLWENALDEQMVIWWHELYLEIVAEFILRRLLLTPRWKIPCQFLFKN